MTSVQFAHIGMNHLVQTNRILAVCPPSTRAAQRYVKRATERGMYIDASRGRSFRSVIILDDGTVITSCISPMTLLKRFSAPEDQLPDDYKEDDAYELLEFNEEEVE